MQPKATGIGLLIATPLIVILTLVAQPLILSKVSAAPATCPANTSEGVYFQRGTDDNGNAICGFAFNHACPYTEAVSADDPLCYKNQPADVTAPAARDLPAISTTPATPTVSTCGGK